MLPPLHQLSIVSSTGADPERCDEHPDDSPFAYELTQEQAARWFDEGSRLGKGTFGETRAHLVPETELRGGPWWVTVKRFTVLSMATREEEAHLKIWERAGSHEACRTYLAMPACMQFPNFGDWKRGNIYTVQMLVNGLKGLGLETETWDDAQDANKMFLPTLPPSAKQLIAEQYGDMIGCFVKAGMLHADLQGGNVLVTHNLRSLQGVDRSEMTSRLWWRFHAIDWGFGESLNKDSYDENGVPKTICLHNDAMNRYNPNASVDHDKLQRPWRLMFGIEEYSDRWSGGKFCRGESWHGVYLLLLGLFWNTSWEEELPYDGVTRAQILDWARRAYLARLGAAYPPEEEQAMKRLIEEERTVPKYKRTHQV